MLTSEKQFNSKSTTDSFDEIYTNYDLAVDESYIADNGYPFDYPTKWLNDPSMNKRIAIRRLNVTPTTHSIRLMLVAELKEDPVLPDYPENVYIKTATIPVTEYDNLTKVMDFMCREFSYTSDGFNGGLMYEYDNKTNVLCLKFKNSMGYDMNFHISDGQYVEDEDVNDNLISLLQLWNQDISSKEKRDNLIELTTADNYEKIYYEVWNRDRLHFHASFSTSRRKFIGKRGDFYQTLTLLYPPPTNESSFYIRFTSNGIKNILIRHCEFDIQLCYIVNYKKATIL